MRIYGEVQVPRHTVKSTTCDTCGRHALREPAGWVHVDFEHNDWAGAEEDRGQRDACSAPCLLAVLKSIADGYTPKYSVPTLSVRVSSLGHEIIKALSERALTE